MQIFLSLVLLIVSISCGKEEYFVLEGTEKDNVKFTALNITVAQGDSAVSTRFVYDFDNYYDYEHPRQDSIKITYYRDYGDINGQEQRRQFSTELEYSNTLWAAGNNVIKVTFHPSCTEEKSAVFTMPDGEQIELTVASPSCEWTMDSESFSKAKEKWNTGYWAYSFPIYAESEYVRRGTNYKNVGYVLIYMNPESLYIEYDKQLNIWKESYWTQK